MEENGRHWGMGLWGWARGSMMKSTSERMQKILEIANGADWVKELASVPVLILCIDLSLTIQPRDVGTNYLGVLFLFIQLLTQQTMTIFPCAK